MADWSIVFAGVAAAATVVTAGGVAVAARQVRQTREQAQVDFEDDLAREYRSIIRDIPARAFIEHGAVVSETELNAFFRYFDLSNEQLFLADKGRVGDDTIAEWRQGILANTDLPMFKAAWESLKDGLPPDYWGYLRPLVAGEMG